MIVTICHSQGIITIVPDAIRIYKEPWNGVTIVRADSWSREHFTQVTSLRVGRM